MLRLPTRGFTGFGSFRPKRDSRGHQQRGASRNTAEACCCTRLRLDSVAFVAAAGNPVFATFSLFRRLGLEGEPKGLKVASPGAWTSSLERLSWGRRLQSSEAQESRLCIPDFSVGETRLAWTGLRGAQRGSRCRCRGRQAQKSICVKSIRNTSLFLEAFLWEESIAVLSGYSGKGLAQVHS